MFHSSDLPNLVQLKCVDVVDRSTGDICKDGVRNDEMNIASSPVCIRCGDAMRSGRGPMGGQIFTTGFRA